MHLKLTFTKYIIFWDPRPLYFTNPSLPLSHITGINHSCTFQQYLRVTHQRWKSAPDSSSAFPRLVTYSVYLSRNYSLKVTDLSLSVTTCQKCQASIFQGLVVIVHPSFLFLSYLADQNKWKITSSTKLREQHDSSGCNFLYDIKICCLRHSTLAHSKQIQWWEATPFLWIKNELWKAEA